MLAEDNDFDTEGPRLTENCKSFSCSSNGNKAKRKLRLPRTNCSTMTVLIPGKGGVKIEYRKEIMRFTQMTVKGYSVFLPLKQSTKE